MHQFFSHKRHTDRQKERQGQTEKDKERTKETLLFPQEQVNKVLIQYFF